MTDLYDENDYNHNCVDQYIEDIEDSEKAKEVILYFARCFKENKYKVETIDKEIDRLKKRKEYTKKNSEDLLNLINRYMVKFESQFKNKIETELDTVSRRKLPVIPEIINEQEMSSEFQKFIISFDVGTICDMDIMALEGQYGEKMKVEKIFSKSNFNKWFKENTKEKENGIILNKNTGEVLSGVKLPELSYTIKIS